MTTEGRPGDDSGTISMITPDPGNGDSQHDGRISPHPIPLSSGRTTRNNASPQGSPEPVTTDLEGHYLGSASGVSFLARAQRRLNRDNNTRQQQASVGLNGENSHAGQQPPATFGDKPFPVFTNASLQLPSRDVGRRLLEVYFNFASPTYRYLHRQSVLGWLEAFYDSEEGIVSVDHGHSAGAIQPSQARKHFETIKERESILLVIMATALFYDLERGRGMYGSEEEIRKQRFVNEENIPRWKGTGTDYNGYG